VNIVSGVTTIPIMTWTIKTNLPRSLLIQAKMNRSASGKTSVRCAKLNGNTMASQSEPIAKQMFVAASNGRAGFSRPLIARAIGAANETKIGTYNAHISSVQNLSVKYPVFAD